MTTNADDDTPDASRVPPQESSVTAHRRLSDTIFERKGDIVRGIYAAFYARHMRQVQHKSVSWPRHSPLWDGGVCRGQNFDSIWSDIARSINRLKLPYFEFIRQIFGMCSRTPPTPDALLSDIGAAQLRQELASFKVEFTRNLEYQIQAHKMVCQMVQLGLAHSTGGDPLFQIIHDNRSNLFLYCHAVAAGAQFHIDNYRRDAFEQYLRCPAAYRETWASILPNGIHQDALTAFGVELPVRPTTGLSPDAGQPGKE